MLSRGTPADTKNSTSPFLWLTSCDSLFQDGGISWGTETRAQFQRGHRVKEWSLMEHSSHLPRQPLAIRLSLSQGLCPFAHPVLTQPPLPGDGPFPQVTRNTANQREIPLVILAPKISILKVNTKCVIVCVCVL